MLNFSTGLWITQINCMDESAIRAPDGCAQYYMGEKGVIKSYNFEGLQYFQGQQLNICLRPEPEMCQVAFDAQSNHFLIAVSILHCPMP